MEALDDASRGGGASVKSSAPRPSAQSGRVSAAGACARAARPMYAQALGATVATLGGAHGGTGATFVAARARARGAPRGGGARARRGVRAPRANAAARRRSATRSSPPGSARWKTRVVSATRVRPKRQTDLASQRITTLTTSSSTFVPPRRNVRRRRRGASARRRRRAGGLRDAALLARDAPTLATLGPDGGGGVVAPRARVPRARGRARAAPRARRRSRRWGGARRIGDAPKKPRRVSGTRSASTKPPRERRCDFLQRVPRNNPPVRTSARGTFCTRARRLTSRPSPRRACA